MVRIILAKSLYIALHYNLNYQLTDNNMRRM
jgi:hypothetical protein